MWDYCCGDRHGVGTAEGLPDGESLEVSIRESRGALRDSVSDESGKYRGFVRRQREAVRGIRFAHEDAERRRGSSLPDGARAFV